MAEKCLPVVVTTPTMPDYMRACLRAWFGLFGVIPLEQSIGVLFAQYMIETGGHSCFGWNLGNVKHVTGDGYDYQMLHGVWEGEPPITADNLIAAGLAARDPSENHAKAVGPSKVSVVFQPPHPATWFRAFATLDDGMRAHLRLLSTRFAHAWPAVIAGDVAAFAKSLHDQGYFTASPDTYAAGMRAPFASLVASSTYEDMIATMHAEPESVAIAPDGDPTVNDWTELDALVSVAHQGASGLIVEDMIDAYRNGDG